MSGLTSSTIGRKYAMALSAMFLLIFLIIHLGINLLSLFSADSFNEASHFMEQTGIIQKVMQPILMIGVIFHFVMGFILEFKNRKARPIKYAINGSKFNCTWMSRNMMISGGIILCFLIIHFGDFWIPTISKNYFGGEAHGTPYTHLQEKFSQLWRVTVYIISFILLGLHLAHGFQSSFQSIGARHPKYTPIIVYLGKLYSILIPLGFICVALYHGFNNICH